MNQARAPVDVDREVRIRPGRVSAGIVIVLAAIVLTGIANSTTASGSAWMSEDAQVAPELAGTPTIQLLKNAAVVEEPGVGRLYIEGFPPGDALRVSVVDQSGLTLMSSDATADPDGRASADVKLNELPDYSRISVRGSSGERTLTVVPLSVDTYDLVDARVTGTTTPNTQLRVTRITSGTPQLSTATSDASGQWSMTFPGGLALDSGVVAYYYEPDGDSLYIADVPRPRMALSLTADAPGGSPGVEVGASVTYHWTLENSGDTFLTGIEVVQQAGSALDHACPGKVAPGARCTGMFVRQQPVPGQWTATLSATSAEGTSASAAATVTVGAAPGAFDRPIAGSGVHSAIWSGGSVSELAAATAGVGGVSVTVFAGGIASVLVPGAPAFVNQDFANRFASGHVAAGTIVFVVRP